MYKMTTAEIFTFVNLYIHRKLINVFKLIKPIQSFFGPENKIK